MGQLPAETAPDDQAVAIVGMGVLAPGAHDTTEFWRLLRGSDPVFAEPVAFAADHIYSPDPAAEDKSYARIGGFIDDDLRGREEEGPRTGDPLPRWLRRVVRQALAGIRRHPQDQFGCYVGMWTGGSRSVEEQLLVSATARGASAHLPGGRAAHEARLRTLLATSYPGAEAEPERSLSDRVVRRALAGLLPDSTDVITVDTACSSSLYTVDIGVKGLASGICDIALCGGVFGLGRRDLVLFCKLNGMSRRGEVRAYDSGADGVLFGEAAAVVTLKRLSRARADGDPVYGLVSGIGLSADGRGMAVTAPNPEGQRRAIQRARQVNGISAGQVDWIVGHGTGTPTGDLVELSVLADLAAESGYFCTSNKSLLGHTAWVSGTVSLIHALLGFRHETIPAQQRFVRPPQEVIGRPVKIPADAVPLPARTDRPRTVAVSGFGFGGTNAHLLVQDTALSAGNGLPRANPPRTSDDLVLVAWTALLPGSPADDHVLDWLGTGRNAPPRSFGPQYPIPPFRELRLPPVTAQTLDRTQLMAIQIANRFEATNGRVWAGLEETTGVIAAHMGPPVTMTGYCLRTCADDLRSAITRQSPDFPRDLQALEAFLAEVKADIPPANDDSMPGLMPNVIASRMANHCDLHGLAMTLDAGRASFQKALWLGAEYLWTGQLDLALVLAINGNSTPEMAALAGTDAGKLAEGAFLFAFARDSTVTDYSLARSGTLEISQAFPAPGEQPENGPAPDYLGAAGAVSALRGLAGHGGRQACADPDHGLRFTWRPAERETVRLQLVRRHQELEPAGKAATAIPPRSVVVVDSAQLATDLSAPCRAKEAVLVSTDPRTPADTAVVYRHAEQAPAALFDRAAPHLRFVSSVHGERGHWPGPPPEELLLLQETALVCMRRFGSRLRDGTAAGLLLDPLTDAIVHPFSTLLSGFVRAVHWEWPAATFAVATDANLETALLQLAAESTAARPLPLVVYRGEQREVETLCRVPLTDTQPARPFEAIGDSPVVVATGGARGITAAFLTELSRYRKPKLWLLGTTPIDGIPAGLFGAGEHEKNALRAKYVAEGLRNDPKTPVPELGKRFDQLWRGREIDLNVRRLTALCGPGKVRYLVCDVTAPAEVAAAARLINAEDGPADLVIYGAGLSRPERIGSTTLADFRNIRDVKVLGYHHLKQHLDVAGLWCNVGSLSGLSGWEGHAGYSPANEFLIAAARYERQLRGQPEITLGWPAWRGTGMANVTSELLASMGMRGLSRAEGLAHWRKELSSGRTPEPAPGFVGEVEVKRINSVVPGLIARQGQRTEGPAFVLAPTRLAPTGADACAAEWEWHPAPAQDTSLLDHLVDGRPTVPAATLMALAAEVALLLMPGQAVAGLHDLRFERFCSAPASRPRGYKVSARALSRTSHGREVLVTVTSDACTPDGLVLARDQTHFEAAVSLAALPEAPSAAVPTLDGVHPLNPYYDPRSPIVLSGAYHNTWEAVVAGARATDLWHAPVLPGEIFERLPIPALLLDAMLRTAVFANLAGDTIGVVVPRRIGRVTLYGTDNDAELTRRHPRGIHLTYDAATETVIATRPDGTVIAAITGLDLPLLETIPVAWRKAPTACASEES